MEKKLLEGVVQHIKYHVTKRDIVPVAVPSTNVKAIDVSALSPTQQKYMAKLVGEYNEYLETFTNRAFNFEEWVQHTKGKKVSPMWRTFKISELQTL